MTNRYIDQVTNIVEAFDPDGSNRYFVFGSSARERRFHDIDLGVVGNHRANKKLSDLRDRFYDSSIPYKVDVVDFDAADSDFRDHVLESESVIWIP